MDTQRLASERPQRQGFDTSERPKQTPPALYALIAVLAFQGLSGVAGGYGLIADPSGESLGIPIAWLEGSPFTDFLIPGVVLITLLGIVPLFVVYGLWTRRPWAWAASLTVGVVLLVWLGVEIAVIGYEGEPPLQAVYTVVAAAIIALTLSASVRDSFYLGEGPNGRWRSD
jgi:hypothetical protein